MSDVTSTQAILNEGLFRPERVTRLMDKARKHEGIGLSNTDNMRLVAVLSTQLLSRQELSGPGLPALPPQPMAIFDFTTRSM